MEDTFVVMRYNRDDGPEIVVTGVTEAQAKVLCNRPETVGTGWFWGYTKELEKETGESWLISRARD